MNRETRRRVLCLGFFDGVHLGHQALLAAGRRLADALGLPCAAVTFDRHPMTLLGGAPKLLTTARDREALLYRVGGVDDVTTLPFTPALRDLPWERFVRETLLEQLQAGGLVVGHDHRFGAGGRGTAAGLAALCASLGLPCTVVPEVLHDGQPVRSTAVRAALTAGDFSAALALLGHPLTLSGTVEHGRQLGHTLGFPTANLRWPEEVLAPQFGVYLGRACAGGRWYPALTNIGVKPTVHGEYPAAETTLQGFSGDLYGRPLTLELTRFLRPERRFDSVEALRAQVLQDLQALS